MKRDIVTVIGLAIICLTIWLCCREICHTKLVIEAGKTPIKLKTK